jgi:hypothetical protein
VENRRGNDGEAESGEAERRTKSHKRSRESWFVRRYQQRLFHWTCVSSGRIDSSRSGCRW